MKHTRNLSRAVPALLSLLLLASCGTADTSADTETAADTTAAVTVSSPETAAETEPIAPISNLLFEDNFDGTELDDSKWEQCPEWERQGALCVWDNDMSYLDGEGHLVLRAEWDAENNRVQSGAVRTAGLFSAGYGYYEASICFPTAPGTWGAFWMMCGNVSGEDDSAADGVEIDIIESIGNDWGACNSALHWDGYGDAHKQVGSGELYDHGIYDGNFHTFALERTEEGYVFYIDGAESWRAAADQCAPCPEDGYMKLTVEAADWAGAGSDACIAGLPAEMLVDYVRVYREKPVE
ncbi:MAG: glycoside hydrolase family 16 protein [Clostridia bacterium]|nr:glycoside hydrolase family 16 protein [Clostridia bacterium]